MGQLWAHQSFERNVQQIGEAIEVPQIFYALVWLVVRKLPRWYVYQRGFLVWRQTFMRSQTFRWVLSSCILVLTTNVQAQTHKTETPKAAASKEIQNPLGQFKTFSANVTGGIAQDHDRKIYRSGNLMRLDFDDSYRVTDLNTLKMWGVSGEHCVEFNRPDAGTFPFSAYHDFKVERFSTRRRP